MNVAPLASILERNRPMISGAPFRSRQNFGVPQGLVTNNVKYSGIYTKTRRLIIERSQIISQVPKTLIIEVLAS